MMNLRNAIGYGLLAAVAALSAALSAEAAGTLLSSDYRYAAQADKTLTEGGGTVAESTKLQRGLRLAAPDAQEKKGAVVATAVYLVEVPLAARLFTIEVGYRPDPAAKDKEVAGLLFIRNKTMEERAAKAAQQGERKPEGPVFLGNLYFLPGNQTTTSVTVPAENHIINGILEVHLSAAAGQAFDAQYVQVAAHRTPAAYAASAGIPAGRANDPLQSPQQPEAPFGTIYGIPNYWPNMYGAGHTTSQDPIFWNQIWNLQYPHSIYYYAPFTFHPRPHRHKD